MNDTPPPDRAELRRRFLAEATTAFDLMFEPPHAGDLVTFDQREQRALELGQQLVIALLQQHANHDPAADPGPEPAAPPCCPRCRRPGRRVTPPAEALPARVVATCAGEITLRRARY